MCVYAGKREVKKIGREQLNKHVSLANSDALDEREAIVILQCFYPSSVRDLERQSRALMTSCDIILQNWDRTSIRVSYPLRSSAFLGDLITGGKYSVWEAKPPNQGSWGDGC